MPKIKNKKKDTYFLKLSNKLSEINQFLTYPNPCVGAVLVSKNKNRIAFTGKGGSPHAEYKLLKNEKNIQNGKLYTSLEPCSHRGKNPSCVEIIIKKGINTIFTSCRDFDKRVLENTEKILKNKGVKIYYYNKICEASSNHNFSCKNRIPYVSAKIAISNDYYTKHKFKRLFTSNEALKFAHLKRYQADSILIGKNTLNDDNPKLNCRINGIEKNICKFLINPNLDIKSYIFKNNFLTNSYIFHDSKDLKKIKKANKNFRLIYFNFNQLHASLKILKKIYELGYKKLLIEGGANTLQRFMDANLVNELNIVKNKQYFTKHGLKSLSKIIKPKKMSLIETILLEDDSILIYKAKNVYRYN